MSALITLARYFANLKSNERTIIFVAFTGEELGLVGSSYFASLVDSSKIVAVFNFDMIGRPISGNLGPYVTGDKYSNLAF